MPRTATDIATDILASNIAKFNLFSVLKVHEEQVGADTATQALAAEVNGCNEILKSEIVAEIAVLSGGSKKSHLPC